MSAPTLEALRAALLQAGMVAEQLKAQEQIGSTYDVAEEVAREIEYLSEQVQDEIAQLRKWGVLQGGDAA